MCCKNSYGIPHSWMFLADLLKHASFHQGHLDLPLETVQGFKEFDHNNYQAHTSHSFIKDPFTANLYKPDMT